MNACEAHPESQRGPVLLRCRGCEPKQLTQERPSAKMEGNMMQDVMNEKKDVEVQVQDKDATAALWGDLTPDKTVLGVLSQVGIMEQRTVQGKTAVALRVEGENGSVVLVTLTAANFADIARKVKQAMLRFGEPWDF